MVGSNRLPLRHSWKYTTGRLLKYLFSIHNGFDLSKGNNCLEIIMVEFIYSGEVSILIRPISDDVVWLATPKEMSVRRYILLPGFWILFIKVPPFQMCSMLKLRVFWMLANNFTTSPAQIDSDQHLLVKQVSASTISLQYYIIGCYSSIRAIRKWIIQSVCSGRTWVRIDYLWHLYRSMFRLTS